MARINAATEAVIAARREKVAALYLQRATQAEIARKVGISQPVVSRDLKAIQAAWMASAVASIDARKAEELARIDRLERTYWRAWHKSRRDSEERRAKTVTGENPRTEASKVERGRDGNPAFLEGVQWCVQKRLEILGVLTQAGGGTTVLVVEGVDLAVVVGQKADPGITYDQLRAAYTN